jgi:hypothetical protein
MEPSKSYARYYGSYQAVFTVDRARFMMTPRNHHVIEVNKNGRGVTICAMEYEIGGVKTLLTAGNAL